MTDADRTRAIKAVLRRKFPECVFSVTRGGERIAWTDDGPAVGEVQDVLLKAGCYTRYRNLLRAAYLLDDHEIYERVAAVIRHASERITAIVRQKGKFDADITLDRRVDLATRATCALLQQWMMFHPLRTGRHMLGNDDDMVNELTALFRMVLAKGAR